VGFISTTSFEHWLNRVGYSVGPTDLTLGAVIVFQLSPVAHAAISGTLSPATNSFIPTVTDNLFTNGDISNHEIGVFFEPTNTVESLNGEVTWG